jgi:hypothetical protein
VLSNVSPAEAIKYSNAPIWLTVSQFERLTMLLNADRPASLLFGLNTSASPRNEVGNEQQLSESTRWQAAQGSPANSTKTPGFGTDSTDAYVDYLFTRMRKQDKNLSYNSQLEGFLRKCRVLPFRCDATICNLQVRCYLYTLVLSHCSKIIINCSNIRSTKVQAFIKKIQEADLLIWLVFPGDSKSDNTNHQRSIFLNGAHWEQGKVHSQALFHDLFQQIYSALLAVATQRNLSLNMDKFTAIWIKAHSLREPAKELKCIGDELKSKYPSITY